MVLEHLVQLVNTFGGDPGVIIYLYLKRNIESRNNVFKYFNSTSSFVTSTYLCINSRSGGRWIVGEGRYVGQNKVCSQINVHSTTSGDFEISGGLGSGIENIFW